MSNTKHILWCLIVSAFFLTMGAGGTARAQCICPFPGDVNATGAIDIADLTYIVDYMFVGGPAPVSDTDCPSPNRADLDCNLGVDIADLTYMVDYMFGGGEAPCNPCDFEQAPDGDIIPLDSLEFLAEHLFNAVYDSGYSVFVYTNQAGHTTEDPYTYMSGDTLVEDFLMSHENDSAFMLVFTPVKNGQFDFDQWQFDGDSPSISGFRAGSFTIPSNLCATSGSSCSPSNVVIQGNTVTCAGQSFTFNSPSPLSPTLQQRLSQTYNNPPPMLTAQQISTACGEGALSFGNYRITSVSFYRTRKLTSGGHTYMWKQIYSFYFENSWEYDCPDGPQKHELFSWWNTYSYFWIDGTLNSSSYRRNYYHYTYP